MCFRPATASGGDVQKNKCPECGKINKPIATECINCGHELTPPEQAGAPDLKMHLNNRPQAPNAQNNSGAPSVKVPVAPQAPAPGAPKVPGAPSKPESSKVSDEPSSK